MNGTLGRRRGSRRPNERSQHEKGDTVVIAVEGQLIAGNRQQLRGQLYRRMSAPSRSFVIDFTETGYADSAGLGVVSLSKIREAPWIVAPHESERDLRTPSFHAPRHALSLDQPGRTARPLTCGGTLHAPRLGPRRRADPESRP